MRWKWRWFSKEVDQPEDTVDLTEMKAEARRALNRSETALVDARKRSPEVWRLGEFFREAREVNHLAERISRTFREAR